MTFKLPELGSQEVAWHENLSPHVLNMYQGKLYVVGTPFSEVEFLQYGKPYPEYVPYRYEAGQWQRIPFSEIPVAIYDTNLLIANAPPDQKEFVSFAIKDEELKDFTLDDPLKKLSATFSTPH